MRPAVLLAAALAAGGCLDHFLIHPKRPPAAVESWREETVEEGLRIRLEWAAPAGPRPGAGGPARLPAVIVHPEAGHSAREMRGIVHALAAEGYLAVAADYRRPGRGGGLFAWRGPSG